MKNQSELRHVTLLVAVLRESNAALFLRYLRGFAAFRSGKRFASDIAAMLEQFNKFILNLRQVHMKAKRQFFVVMGLVLSSLSAAALASKESPVTLSSERLPANARWLFDPKAKAPKASASLSPVIEMRRAQTQSDFAKCLKLAPLAWKAAPAIAAWIGQAALQCGIESTKKNKESFKGLTQVIARVEQSPDWLNSGIQRESLLRHYIRGTLVVIESNLKLNRTKAWSDIEKLSRLESQLNLDEKAELYRLAGEVLFVEQTLDGAQNYFERSLKAKPTASVRERLKAFKSALAEDLSGGDGSAKDRKKNKAVVADADVSGEEAQLIASLTTALKGGDLLSAVEDAAKMAHHYPGSTRTAWAEERILESYFVLMAKTDPQFNSIKDRYFRQMLKFNGETLFDWAKKIYGRGGYSDAYRFASKAASVLADFPQSTAVTFLAARSALATDQFDAASELFQDLLDKHSGTQEAMDALFYKGLLEFRFKNYSKAAGQFERLLVLPKAENWELSGRYWLWRSLQLQQSPRADEQKQILIQKFPFSYYGIRAQIEDSHNLSYQWKPQKSQVRLWLMPPERLTLKRAELLMQVGWWEEAQQELRTLPEPTQPQAKAVMALYFAQAMDFGRATALVNEAWEQDPSIRNPPFLGAAFPGEFASSIQDQARATRMDPVLVRSLIKQESAFGLRAVSSSGALGLMQLIPPTAQEVAAKLGLKNLKVPDDLFQFDTNIQMGSYYLGSMLDRYQHHVPMALAAYNAGPYRLERWLNSRPSLADLSKRRSSSPENEMWIEELPWSETRFYVKAILRNSLIYQALEQGRVEVPDPVWRDLVKNRLVETP